MFAYLKGSLVEVDTSYAVIDVNGVGYKVLIPANIYSDLLTKKEVLLHTTFIVREDSQQLFGFLTKEQRTIFEMLLSVTGIGPKSALAIAGNLEAEHFYSAISDGDIRLICKAPGVGKKTAQRLIIELKDKLKGKYIPLAPTNNSSITDAISALIGLGYSIIHAQKAVQSVYNEKEDQDLSSLITAAIKTLQ